jgi:uncharacterized protein (DUF1330 family)
MAKGYWISIYRSVSDQSALAKYASVAGPVIQAHGGRFLVRGTAAKAYEAGLVQRVVIVEFESVEQAIAAYESPEYKSALAILAGSVDRDVRIVEGV